MTRRSMTRDRTRVRTGDLAISIGARVRLAGARIGRRWPTVFLGIAIACFAVGPQWVLASHLPYRLLMLAIPAQQLLLVAAAAANAARYGLRPGIAGWPLLAVLLLLAESLLAADRDPRLTAPRMALAALGLALPWCLAAVVVEPGTRARYALLIALLPGLCVAIGFGLQAAGLHAAYLDSGYRSLRLSGASNPGWLVCLALAGFAIALHEAIRTAPDGLRLPGRDQRRDRRADRRPHGGRCRRPVHARLRPARPGACRPPAARPLAADRPWCGGGAPAARLAVRAELPRASGQPRAVRPGHHLGALLRAVPGEPHLRARNRCDRARHQLLQAAAQRLSAPVGRGRRGRLPDLRRRAPALGPAGCRPGASPASARSFMRSCWRSWCTR